MIEHLIKKPTNEHQSTGSMFPVWYASSAIWNPFEPFNAVRRKEEKDLNGEYPGRFIVEIFPDGRYIPAVTAPTWVSNFSCRNIPIAPFAGQASSSKQTSQFTSRFSFVYLKPS